MTTIDSVTDYIITNMQRTKDIPGVTDTIILQDNHNGNLFIFLGENHKQINQEMMITYTNGY